MINIKNTRAVCAPRLVIYGAEGMGKSTMGARFPSALFFQTEDGLKNIDAVSAGLYSSFTELITDLSYIVSHPDEFNQYKSIILDSLDCLERIMWDEVAKQNKVTSIEKLPYGRGYNIASDYFRQLLAVLTALREAGKIIVLIAHSGVIQYNDPETPDLRKYDLRLHKTTRALVAEWADAVLFLTRARGTARGASSELVLKSIDSQTSYAKSRYNLPERLDVNPAHLLELIAKDQTRKAEEVPF